MPEPDTIFWYQYDVLPLVGFVRAEDAEHAKMVALDDAVMRLRAFLEDSPLHLDPVMRGGEVIRDDATSARP